MATTTGWIYSVKGKKLLHDSVWVKVSWCQMTLSKKKFGRKWVATQVIDETRPKRKRKRKQTQRLLFLEMEGGCTWVPLASIPLEVASLINKEGKASSRQLRNVGQRKYVVVYRSVLSHV